jgi:hypothetical protein
VDYASLANKALSETGMKQWSSCEYDNSDKAIALVKVPFQISLADLYNKVQLEAKAIECDRV